jgi:N-6 DNA Methylase
MLLDWLHNHRHWPSPERILDPSGAGPRVVARQAREKIGGALNNLPGGNGVSCGIVMANPESPETEAPSAIVCEFPRTLPDDTLRQAQRLAWNFSKSTTLITLQPHLIRTWSCCEVPKEDDDNWNPGAELVDLRSEIPSPATDSDNAALAFEWVRLIAGEHVRSHPGQFRRDGRADITLLNQLKNVRRTLQEIRPSTGSPQKLDDDTIHDLLARVIFIQFLWDRKDSEGNAALDVDLLGRLYDDHTVGQLHPDPASVLGDYNDAYKLFRWLNGKFNGDLFPGKGRTDAEREEGWRREMALVKPTHLQELANLVSGRFQGRQGYLWKLYSFDVIPLEFISTIYEEFVKAQGAHYTPGALADFVLDGVLPWEGIDWNLRVIDPACGSGVFLVKAFLRLVERWRNAHPGERPPVAILRQMLEQNLFGVDSDHHAVRVASFSLYLTMCDQVEPRRCLEEVQFPHLRDKTLVFADFFDEDKEGFRTEHDAGKYDVVVGNAPWGRDLLTGPAAAWAKDKAHKWPILGTDIATLFLPKSLGLVNASGVVSMIQPAGNLLFNIASTGRAFRKKLFSTYHAEEVVNLSALRFELFDDGSASPCCVITLRPHPPTEVPIVYTCPKPLWTSRPRKSQKPSVYQLVIDSTDVNEVTHEEAAYDPLVWNALFRGGRRDLQLLKKLGRFDTLERLEEEGRVRTRRGAVRGKNKRDRHDDILGMPLLSRDKEIDDCFLFLRASELQKNEDAYIRENKCFALDAFKLPQMLVKLSWKLDRGRFKAVIVESDESTGPVLCERNCFSVHSNDMRILEASCIGLNSTLAVYYLLLSSYRFAAWVPEPNKEQIMRLPLPPLEREILSGIRTYEDIDSKALASFCLNDAENVLIEDLHAYTLRDFKGWEDSPGRQPTNPDGNHDEILLSEYCRYFLRVLRAGFGDDKDIAATIFRVPADSLLPMRLVALHLDSPRVPDVRVEEISSQELLKSLHELDLKMLRTVGRGESIYQRVARVYDAGEVSGKHVLTVYIVKPDLARYWTRSIAMRDADEVAADLVVWSQPEVRIDSLKGVPG